MNQRILELIEQSTFDDPGCSGDPRPFFDKEKFAELIVKECMKVVINGKYSATECERNTHRIAHNNARDEALSDIKKHFGVKE